MSAEAAFHFHLSPAEVHWLAGAFGLTHLPLPDDPLRGLPFSQIEAELRKAFSSLQARGLLRRTPGLGWQVDRLPAALVRWLGEARWMLVLEVQHRGESARRLNAFLTGKEAMSVALENDVFHFVLYPGLDLLIAETLAWLNLSRTASLPDRPAFSLPQPETVIPTAWRDRSLAASMLKVAGMAPEQAQEVLAWLDTLQWLASWTQVKWRAEKAEVGTRAIWCGDGRSFWVGTIAQEKERKRDWDVVTLSPVLAERLPMLLRPLFFER